MPIIRKLFNQHKKKIFYTLGILFLLNLILIISDTGVLIRTTYWVKVQNKGSDGHHWVKMSKSESKQFLRKKFPNRQLSKNFFIACDYWIGRQLIKDGRGRNVSYVDEYVCPMTARLKEIQ